MDQSITRLLVIIVIFVFSSCKSQDDNTSKDLKRLKEVVESQARDIEELEEYDGKLKNYVIELNEHVEELQEKVEDLEDKVYDLEMEKYY